MVRPRGMLALGALAALFAFLACQESGSEPAPTETGNLVIGTVAPTATAAPPSPSPSPSPTVAPTPSPTPGPLAAADAASVRLSPAGVQQGEVFTVSLLNAGPTTSATTSFAGLRYPMLWTGDMWWVVIGVAADFLPGQYQIEVIEDGLMRGPILVVTVLQTAFPEEFIELAPEQSQLLTDPAAIEQERALLASIYAVVTPDRLWSGPFVLPTAGPLGDTFGMQRSFNGGPFSHHTGLDILAGQDEPVVAANSGRVAFAGDLHLRGGSVVIDHGAGVFSGYHHLSQVSVVEGQDVAQGEVIGTVGETGLVTGPHLHWEIVVHGVRVDPLPWTQAEIGP